MRKNRQFIYQFVALLVVLSLGIAQTVLLTHENHSIEHSHDLADSDSSAPQLSLKCGVCDYIFHKQSEPALIASPLSLTFFLPAIDRTVNKSVPGLSNQHAGKYLSRGPPLA